MLKAQGTGQRHFLTSPESAGEDYTPPEKAKYTAFAGRGRTLTGAAFPHAYGCSSMPAGCCLRLMLRGWLASHAVVVMLLSGHAGEQPAASSARPPPDPATSFQTTWAGVDESQPSTSVQLRLLDGSRMVCALHSCNCRSRLRHA